MWCVVSLCLLCVVVRYSLLFLIRLSLWSLVDRCGSLVVALRACCGLLRVVALLVLYGYVLLVVVCCLQYVVRCLSVGVRCLTSIVVCYLVVVVAFCLFGMCRVMLVDCCCLLFIIVARVLSIVVCRSCLVWYV